MASNNMYRVGDFVYFEVSASAPYQIRKIEELNKTSTGAVEAKVVCFYRRRDLSVPLIQLADKHQSRFLLCVIHELTHLSFSFEEELSVPTDNGQQPDLLHQIRHRELFLSRQLETLPATHIRGKCTVTLHNETEPCIIYLTKEDAFFFKLVYDPVQKTLQADRGVIREGSEYQAEIPPYKPPSQDPSQSTEDEANVVREELRWKPNPDLTPADLNSFLLLTRSLGTLGRAYHPASSLRQPTLSMSAAAAARDATHQLAVDTLHQANYDIAQALRLLSPNGQPVMKLDEMELWSASEGNLFEEALEKYGKCFYDIQSDFLPWKHPKSLIEFYYMWKTTDHYIQQKRIKAAEAEHHLKQVYIPNYNKPNPAVLYAATSEHQPSRCEGCQCSSSTQWYALGPAASPLKVCTDCWNYWKRYGDLKAASILDKACEAASAAAAESVKHKGTSSKLATNTTLPTALLMSDGSLAGKLRSTISFQFVASPLLRLLRRLCPISISNKPVTARRRARRPFKPCIALALWQTEAQCALSALTTSTAIRRFTQHLKSGASSKDFLVRSGRLKALMVDSFPNLNALSYNGVFPSERHKNLDSQEPPTSSSVVANSLDCQPTRPDSSLSLAIKTSSTMETGNVRKRPPSQDTCVPITTNDGSPPALQLSGTNSHPTKKPHLSTDVEPRVTTGASLPPDSSMFRLSTVVGPKRRSGTGPDGNGANTLMFLATESAKRNRRKRMTVAELRRFGRRPHTAALVNFSNGLPQKCQSLDHNCSSSSSSTAIVTTSTTSASTSLPPSDSCLKKDSTIAISTAATASPSNSNSMV
ncbi:hypothetical protein AHF37_06787 [Paragonimus kellicotti]|nr:hypothetical protein AHF37_06787 [Paragonimus kellicotti]